MFHLNSNGDVLPCKAKHGRCPYAAADHFEGPEEGRKAFEERNSSVPSIKRSIPHEMELSEEVVDLLDTLHDKGFTPYIVGGSVRDSVLSGLESKDIDIEVFDAPDMNSLEKALRKSGYRVDAVGKSFGVLKLQLLGGEDIDVSLPRKDSKVGDGHRGFEVEVDPKLNMIEAAGRRDFTVNSLYYSQREKRVKDPFGGLEDWKQGKLRHINENFGDDPLRVIRGVRFSSRFGIELAPETVEISKALKGTFKSLSEERIQTEFEKIFAKGDLRTGMKTLKQIGWDEEMHLHKVSPATIEASAAAIARAKELNEDAAVFGTARLIATDVDKAHAAKVSSLLLTKLKRQQKALSLPQQPAPQSLSEKHMRAWTRAISKNGITAKDYYIYHGDEALRKAAEKFGIFEKADEDLITGAKVLEATGGKPGPWIGSLIREANKAQDERLFKNESEAAEWLRRRVAEGL